MEQRYPATGSGQFVAARLQTARHARGLKQNELAEGIGRLPVMISKWESDAYDNVPDTAAISALAELLSVSPGWFFKPITSAISYPFYRSLRGELNRARDKLSARLQFVDVIHEALNERVEFPSEDIPDLMGDRDYRVLRQDDIEAIAEGARQYWALGDDPIDDLMVIIENAGIAVAEDFVGSTKLDGVSAWSSRDVGLMLLGKDKNNGVRRRYDAAHELGHLLLHRGLKKEDFASDLVLIEEQAMAFAGAFLLPSSSFSSDIHDTTLDELADKKPKWRVSIAAMIKRLDTLNLVSSEYARNLWKYYSYRQWRGHEPFDDSIPIERPVNLKSAIELVVSEGIGDTRHFVADVGLFANDIHELTGVDKALLEPRERERPRLKLVNSKSNAASERAKEPQADND